MYNLQAAVRQRRRRKKPGAAGIISRTRLRGRYSRFFTRGHHVRVVLAAFSRRPGLVALDRASSLQGDAGAVVHRTEDPGFCFRFAEDGVTATRVVDLPRPTCW